jgi:hypothetical protein
MKMAHLHDNNSSTVSADLFYLVEAELFVLVLALLWCLMGLLVWLECYGETRPKRHVIAFIVTFLCGPAAWITSAWTILHRRRLIVPTKVMLPESWKIPLERN